MTGQLTETRVIVTKGGKHTRLAQARTSKRKRWVSVGMATGAWVSSMLLFIPIAYMVLKSFQTEQVAANATPQLFFVPTLEHYVEAFESGIWPYAINSFVVVIVSTFVVIALALPAAWALSVRAIQNPQDSLFFFISTKMMPIAAGIIPVYVIASQLGLLNSVTILIIMHLGMNLPLGIWMLRSFMQEIPHEILEAAAVDGASSWRVGWSIVLPLMRPGIASTALLCAVFSWNEYFYAANLTTTNSTLPLFMQKFLSFGELYTAQVAAVAVVVSIPVVIAGWIAQKSLVRGLLFGAVK
ncbi:carbohydrate ABC transporter permease [Microbacterium invictum]|uniref:Sorbitol/mannitol transport system permease protein n=1 Tax=Microbacterium invictum TaxID=515415 RepID=A0AA40SRD0_9MICO|nr:MULTISPECIES: carbohydrate ABC transporter permease [Microbacterium]MBB4140835.1 sorbitol/mannitol transport system permease protein [Microbacterium invictum]